MEVEISEKTLNEVQAAVADIKNGYKQVLVTSINKTITTTKVQATARIGNELNLKAARIKQDFVLQKANFGKLSGAVIATGEPVGLINFGANQIQKGVTVKVLRASPRSLLKHAFITTGRKGQGQHVFWRKNRVAGKKFPVGKKSTAPWPKFGAKYRGPVERLTGPRIEDIFAQAKVLDPVTIQANHLFLSNVDEKISEIIRRHA